MTCSRPSGAKPRCYRWLPIQLGIALAIGFATPGAAQDGASGTLPKATRADGPSYLVSDLVVTYVDPNPQFPAPFELSQLEVELAQSADGLVGPHTGLPSVRFRLVEFAAKGTQRVYGSALRALNQQLVFEFNRRDFHAIVVAPLEEDIERRTGRDLRPEGELQLRLGVYAGRVKDLRSFASGDEFDDDDEKLDLPEHAWIREGSPIQANTDNDLVRKDELDEYLARLNRHPARRVDAEISPAREVGGVNLDYMVAENKPWWAYFVIENTGTEETTDLRERFGLAHSDLTGRNDLIQLDYITGDFDEVHAIIGSYETPITRHGRVKVRAFGDWSEYDASVLGFSKSFTGEQTDVGGQLIVNVFQYKELFVDLLGGGQYQKVKVKNDLSGTRQAEEFSLGMLGMRTERQGVASSLNGELSLLHNFDNIAGTSRKNLPELGRLGVDDTDFSILRWNIDLSFFVEPLFSPRSWRDPSLIDTASLAHEIALSFSGQDALGNRLIPQQEQVVGGLYTVRGYEESALVGDDVLIGSAEYRLHLPRLLAPSTDVIRVPMVGEFHGRPKYQYTFPDWDLIFRAFIDAGRVDHVDADSFEKDQSAVGAGVGLELRVLRYLSARMDFAWALNDVDITDTDEVESGDREIHFSVTLLY